MVQELLQLLSLIGILLLVAFWVWMFRDMMRNDALPERTPGPLSWPPASKYDWTIIFIVLSIFAAACYYAYEYRRRR